MLSIAYERVSKATTVIASQWSCAESTVRKVTKVVAQSWRQRQESMLIAMSEALPTLGKSWTYMIRSLRWDETKEKVTVPIDPKRKTTKKNRCGTSLWPGTAAP